MQCKTLMITSWSAKGIDTQNAWVVSKLVQEAERPTRHNSKKNTTAGLMRIEMTARALFERPTEVKYTEPGSSKISLMKRQESSHTNPCKNSRVSNAAAYQPTLLWPVETSRRSVRQYPSHAISQPTTTRSNSTQTQLRLPSRPTTQSFAPCRLLGLSRDRHCPLLRRLSNAISTKILNGYENQRNTIRLHQMIMSTYFVTRLLFQMLSLFGCKCACVSVRLRIHHTVWTMIKNSFAFVFCKRCYLSVFFVSCLSMSIKNK